jgi:hypothetical protein
MKIPTEDEIKELNQFIHKYFDIKEMPIDIHTREPLYNIHITLEAGDGYECLAHQLYLMKPGKVLAANPLTKLGYFKVPDNFHECDLLKMKEELESKCDVRWDWTTLLYLRSVI